MTKSMPFRHPHCKCTREEWLYGKGCKYCRPLCYPIDNERPTCCGKCESDIETETALLISFKCKSISYFLKGKWHNIYICGRRRR